MQGKFCTGNLNSSINITIFFGGGGSRSVPRPVAHMTIFLIQQFSKWSGPSWGFQDLFREPQGQNRGRGNSPVPFLDSWLFSSIGAARVTCIQCHLTSSLPGASQGFPSISTDILSGQVDRMVSSYLGAHPEAAHHSSNAMEVSCFCFKCMGILHYWFHKITIFKQINLCI